MFSNIYHHKTCRISHQLYANRQKLINNACAWLFQKLKKHGRRKRLPPIIEKEIVVKAVVVKAVIVTAVTE